MDVRKIDVKYKVADMVVEQRIEKLKLQKQTTGSSINPSARWRRAAIKLRRLKCSRTKMAVDSTHQLG
jgi:hypothetical protein